MTTTSATRLGLRRFFSDTIFTRLFGLAMGAVIVSHIMTFILLFVFLGDRFPHPRAENRLPLSAQIQTVPPDNLASLRHLPPHEDHFPGPMLGFFLSMSMQFLILAIAAWYGSRNLAKPIQSLAHAASQIGDNLNAPALLETGPAEARQAANVFNKMRERIRLQLEERGRFLAAVSHDLRTPLTRMKLRIEHLDDDAAKDKLQQDIEEMRLMLDATLEYLRSNGKATVAGQLLDVQALVEALVDNAQEQGHQVHFSGDAQPLFAIISDLRRCISNLLENALSHGKEVEVILHDSPDQLLIQVVDDGPGIPPDQLLQVFEPFVRLSESRNRNSGGVGLGLSIAREIARQHAGDLVLFNNTGRRGLTAQISLPRKLPF
ncbi:ATP-binding protein [Undibacterium sp. RTI2.1]|uniref:ATP-binding protein n=1 Tax=unclassified Undibacterium TaxID=2630295 RepID=UPI002AB428E4|nr:MULTISPECIES: ATP-binding protein [unclassified Undibacterium]MDY7538700.1 ATP-binding protein [Undibacterium sp. 5I1]MEB0030244.1 ATP-binding protein [Undibacterium sp. RTI2.1]MEB0116868.1 ATP-binding protein [Undibacterium sp. RTI2.2]MEB0229639.1 ATP-binding protein [Undibacterium sp. 10I3]MEB0259088.1 ATP-binding protein [Undibacterium sp. 5I1]